MFSCYQTFKTGSISSVPKESSLRYILGILRLESNGPLMAHSHLYSLEVRMLCKGEDTMIIMKSPRSLELEVSDSNFPTGVPGNFDSRKLQLQFGVFCEGKLWPLEEGHSSNGSRKSH